MKTLLPTPPKPLVPAGTRVRVGQQVRVGELRWTAFVTGTVVDGSVRPVGGMEMGAKSRFSYQPTLCLRLDDGEITVVAVDELTTVETLSDPKPQAS